MQKIIYNDVDEIMKEIVKLYAKGKKCRNNINDVIV